MVEDMAHTTAEQQFHFLIKWVYKLITINQSVYAIQY